MTLRLYTEYMHLKYEIYVKLYWKKIAIRTIKLQPFF
jgi:hypothetical protein